MKNLSVLFLALILLGCTKPASDSEEPAPAPEAKAPAKKAAAPVTARSSPQQASEYLDAVLEEKPDEFKARYQYRNPKHTLQFFGVKPGMTVIEALPGAGWYTQILIPYLGKEGHLIGANYAQEMWPLFGFYDEEYIASMEDWTTEWPEEVEAWRGGNGATVDAMEFGSLPVALKGQADVVLFIRALHNLARFESEGGFLTAALQDAFDALKPGGVVGVVQHEARSETPDEWADGSHGYLKKQFVTDSFKKVGFQFVDETDINANPQDKPGPEESVWRLPPSYQGSREDPELRQKMDEIGESNRMTLKFRKPQSAGGE